jgi:hypothetical protein
MSRRIILAVFAAAISVTSACAADLPVQSRLGAVFADPPPYQAPPAAFSYRTVDYNTVYAPQVDIPPLVAGYYGKPNSYVYSPYYGESLYWNFTRLPYACGFYGYC